MVLAKGGQVLSWGRGTWGQTGHGTTDNIFRPRLIAELHEHTIVQARLLPCLLYCAVRRFLLGNMSMHWQALRILHCTAGGFGAVHGGLMRMAPIVHLCMC